MWHPFARFSAGFSLGLLVAVSVNLIPYLSSRNAFLGDGFEVAGFPFTFHSRGGYLYTHSFNSGLLWIDILVGLCFAVAVGTIAVFVLRYVRRRGRGFPVLEASREDPEAG